jgi:hypothetical protein
MVAHCVLHIHPTTCHVCTELRSPGSLKTSTQITANRCRLVKDRDWKGGAINRMAGGGTYIGHK